MKPALIPLKQWYCDTCGEVIEKPEDGYLEWRIRRSSGSYKHYGFRIVHHAPRSPRRRANGAGDCYYSRNERGGDSALTDFVGVHGIVCLSAFIDVGKEISPDYAGPEVEDLREWTTLFRRLQLPYFEEARRYLPQARSEDYGDANEVYLYLPEQLKKIIEKYGEE